MTELERSGLRIIELYLEKLEKLSDRERAVIISAIELMNKPILITGNAL